ncbi:hypothetical protein RRG08_018870 [Elysia crispata]|uniref:Uncharacterized protein n=1 Tax=Elysia crispata TaxID=231223 RepID=A0AAE1B6R3_9GAST|nr:hypothetical protein RRG08_018870 [Elysia crispata]
MSVHSLPGLVKGDNDKRMPGESRWRTLIRQEKSDLLSVALWRAAFAEFVGTGLLCTFTIGFGMTPQGEAPPPVLQVRMFGFRSLYLNT